MHQYQLLKFLLAHINVIVLFIMKQKQIDTLLMEFTEGSPVRLGISVSCYRQWLIDWNILLKNNNYCTLLPLNVFLKVTCSKCSSSWFKHCYNLSLKFCITWCKKSPSLFSLFFCDSVLLAFWMCKDNFQTTWSLGSPEGKSQWQLIAYQILLTVQCLQISKSSSLSPVCTVPQSEKSLTPSYIN